MRRVDETPDDDPIGGGETFLLTARLESLTLSFAGSDGEWTEIWSQKGLPPFARVELVLNDGASGRETFRTEVPLWAGRSF